MQNGIDIYAAPGTPGTPGTPEMLVPIDKGSLEKGSAEPPQADQDADEPAPFAKRRAVQPWSADFPPVFSHVAVKELAALAADPAENVKVGAQSAAYKAAKAGDADAAARIVTAAIDPEAIADLGRRFPNAVVVFVHAEEAAGRNALPGLYAQAIGDITGLPVRDKIVQTNRVHHTGAGAWHRLVTPPAFDGPVEGGRDHILVDDAMTTGSSLAALRHYIESRGGRVVLATTLAHAPSRWPGVPGTQLAISPATQGALRRKFDAKEVDAILWHHGVARSIQELTESQGQLLLGELSSDAIRDRIAAAGRAAVDQGGQGPLPPSQAEGEVRDREEPPRFARRDRSDDKTEAGAVTGDVREFGSTQISLPPEMTARILDLGRMIPDDMLADKGRESEPHITVKYGLHTDDAAQVRAALAKVSTGPARFMLGNITVFPAKKEDAPGGSEGADVVKVDVISGGPRGLQGLNKRIAGALEHTDPHPTYQPHITIAYVKAGEGERIARSLSPVRGMTGQADALTFSNKTGQRTEMPLGGKGTEASRHEGTKGSDSPPLRASVPNASVPSAERFKVSEQDLRRAWAYGEGEPSAPFAWGVKQFIVDKAARLRDVPGVTREEAIEARRGYDAARAGASRSVREDLEDTADRQRGADADQPGLFAKRLYTGDAIPGVLTLGDLNADSYTDPLWKALAHDGRLPQPDIHTGHRTAIGRISEGFAAPSGRTGGPALGADFPPSVRRREQATHRSIEGAHRRIAALLKTDNEALISTYITDALTDHSVTMGDAGLDAFVSQLRRRIPIVPAKRWTAGLDLMAKHTQEALVYSSPTGAVYKLIKTNEDGTAKGAVRLDAVRTDPQGRPWLDGSVHRNETPLLEALRRIDRANEHGGFVFTELAAITADGQFITKQPLIDGRMEEDPTRRAMALEKVGLRPVGMAGSSAVATLPDGPRGSRGPRGPRGRVLGAIDLHFNNLRIIGDTAFIFDAANDLLTTEQEAELRRLLPREPKEWTQEQGRFAKRRAARPDVERYRDLDVYDRRVYDAIREHIDPIAAGKLNEYGLFDMAYGPLPVKYKDGEWRIPAPMYMDTGVTDKSALWRGSRPRTLGQLASALRLDPWSLALDYGWPEWMIDADAFIKDHGLAGLGGELAAARREIADQAREEADYQRFIKEEGELADKEENEARDAARGVVIEYSDAASLKEAADELGMPQDSETVRLYYERKLHKAEALRRAGVIIARHEDTDYDALLARGIDRDTARAMIQGKFAKRRLPSGANVTVFRDIDALGFYSPLLRAAQALPGGDDAKMTPRQAAAFIAKQPGVKPEEILWSGFDQFMNERGREGTKALRHEGTKGGGAGAAAGAETAAASASVTKGEIVDYIRSNQVMVEEVVLGGPLSAEGRGRISKAIDAARGRFADWTDENDPEWSHVSDVTVENREFDASWPDGTEVHVRAGNPDRQDSDWSDGGWVNAKVEFPDGRYAEAGIWFNEDGEVTPYSQSDVADFDAGVDEDGEARRWFTDEDWDTIQAALGKVKVNVERSLDGGLQRDKDKFDDLLDNLEAAVGDGDADIAEDILDQMESLESRYGDDSLTSSIRDVFEEETEGDVSQYEKWTLPGADPGSYREILLTLPAKTFQTPRVDAEVEALGRINTGDMYRASHFEDTPNVIAHARVNDRVDADGKRLLFIEEIQSDWGQEGRDAGFSVAGSRAAALDEVRAANADLRRAGLYSQGASNSVFHRLGTNDGVFEATAAEAAAMERMRAARRALAEVDEQVPDAPFVKSTDAWAGLALRRMIRLAAEQGYDTIAWTTGQQQIERYDLSKQIDSLEWEKTPGGDIDGKKDGVRIATQCCRRLPSS